MSALPKRQVAATEAINHWRHIEQYVKIPTTEIEHKKQMAFLDELMFLAQTQRNNKHIISLLQLIGRNIESYEKTHFSYAKLTPLDALKYLLNEHGLKQTDLPEIGSQSLVSKILKGERKITAEHITLLAKRFNVSPTVFLNQV